MFVVSVGIGFFQSRFDLFVFVFVLRTAESLKSNINPTLREDDPTLISPRFALITFKLLDLLSQLSCSRKKAKCARQFNSAAAAADTAGCKSPNRAGRAAASTLARPSATV
ncbi:hypothetical protein K449DRAFT_404134 [Hypoxylon sp. EC38]|nr:hypothetical protein K449DRAFT_404134 [Hypoxylon sp. EC38]